MYQGVWCGQLWSQQRATEGCLVGEWCERGAVNWGDYLAAVYKNGLKRQTGGGEVLPESN